MSQPVLDLPIHDPQLLLRVGPNDLVAGDPAGMPGRRVDLEVAGQAAPERKLLGLAPGQVVQRSSRRPLRKRFRWWGCQDLNLGLHPETKIARVATGSAAPRRADLGRATRFSSLVAAPGHGGLIRDLRPGVFPQDRSCDLGE
jgi:hypothetical protein